MTRAVLHLAACLAGFVLGMAATEHPLARMLGQTTVVWEATRCPDGEYTITTQARSIGGRGTYQTTSTHVVLPKSAVVHDFPDLPPGDYSISAQVRRSDGQTFGSDVRRVTVLGESADMSAPALGGRRRPASVEPVGLAQPRKGRDQTAPSASAAQTQLTPARTQSVATTSGKSPNRTSAWITVSDLEQVLIQFDATTDLGGGSKWRRITIVDSDADGLTDLVLIETATGDMWLFGITR